MTNSDEGYVYFIYENEPWLKSWVVCNIKIGMSKNDPQKRLTQLQTGNRKNLTVYRAIITKDYKKLERELHDKYAKYRIRPNGEWFKITKRMVRSECKLHQKVLDYKK